MAPPHSVAVLSAHPAHGAGSPGPSAWRLGAALWLLGMPGVVAVVWALLPTLREHQEVLPLPLWSMVLLGGLQTSVLLVLAVALGAGLAHRVGLRAPAVSAWLLGQPVGSALRTQWRAGALGGVAGAAWLWALAQLAPAALTPADAASALPLAVKLLYGGITEELLARWGVMSVLLWLGWRVVQRGQGRPSRALVALAIGLSALVFAAGHLPAALAMAGALDASVLAYVLVGNTAFGLVAGWLYARHGLEAAILAHMLAHALAHPLL